MRGLRVRYLRLEEGVDREGARIAVPMRWEGSMRNRSGELRYEAWANTPSAPLVSDGGFQGFEFEGEWKPKKGAVELIKGVGFSEFADFGGSLLKLRDQQG